MWFRSDYRRGKIAIEERTQYFSDVAVQLAQEDVKRGLKKTIFQGEAVIDLSKMEMTDMIQTLLKKIEAFIKQEKPQEVRDSKCSSTEEDRVTYSDIKQVAADMITSEEEEVKN